MNNIKIYGMFNVRLFKVTYFLNCDIRLWEYISQLCFISFDEGQIGSCGPSIKEVRNHGICQGKDITSIHNTKLKK